MEGHEHEEIPDMDLRSRYEEIKGLKPLRQGEFIGEEKEGFYVMLSEDEVYELSPLAYYVWILCDGNTTVEEMAKKIGEEAQVEFREVIEPLVLALEQMREVNLVKY